MNPFRETIVADPWNTPRGDVRTIHQNVFNACLRGIEHVRSTRRSAALLIHGEAGSGKTHLLSRLRSQLALKHPTASDRDESLYVWVRLQTSPRTIWRTLRRTLVNDWFRPLDESRCQFDRILFHRLAEIRVAEGDLEPWHEYMLQENPQGLSELIGRIADSLHLDRNTAVAFEHLAFLRHRRDLRAWLSGDSLPEAALDRMELTQDEGSDDDREAQARQVVLMLCRLAGNGLPIVLSFDQVEALEAHPGDSDAMFAFGQLVSTIHDSTTNVLIISSVQSAFATRLADQSRDADRDRMRSLGALSLSSLTHSEAEALVAARWQTADAVPPSQVRQNALWPLSDADVTLLFSKGNVSPRRLLARCAERFDDVQVRGPLEAQTAATDRQADHPADHDSLEAAFASFLEDEWQSVVDAKLKSNSPDQTDEILQYALPAVVQSLDPKIKPVRDKRLPDVSLVFEKDGSRTGVSVCTPSNMNSLTARLKRLEEQLGLRRIERLVIVRDNRRPMTATAKKAKERLAALEERGAVVVYPTVEVLAALDALRSLLSDAKSGDLSFHGQTVQPRSLEEWFTAHLPHGLQEFVGEVLGSGNVRATVSSETVSIEALNSVLADQPVVSLNAAAEKTSCSVDELVATTRRHPDQFGILGEPPDLLFRITETAERSPEQSSRR